MIQAITKTNILTTAEAGIVVTEDNRIYNLYQSPAASDLIGKPVPKTQIRHLFKFINQMDKSVQYAYNKGGDANITDRYTDLQLPASYFFCLIQVKPSVLVGHQE